MIRENQQLLNRLNVVSDGVLIYLMLPVAYWLRFYVLRGGIVTEPLSSYLRIGVVFTLVQLFTYAAFRLYQGGRQTRLMTELRRLLLASLLGVFTAGGHGNNASGQADHLSFLIGDALDLNGPGLIVR